MLKTYRIYRENSKPITIRENGISFTPNFILVGLYKEFSTRDKAMQDALEADRRFKSAYFLSYTEADEEAPLNPPKMEKTPPSSVGFVDDCSPPEVELEGAVEAETYPDITTTQAAKAFLRAKGIEIANSASKEKVIEKAKAHGIEFSELT